MSAAVGLRRPSSRAVVMAGHRARSLPLVGAMLRVIARGAVVGLAAGVVGMVVGIILMPSAPLELEPAPSAVEVAAPELPPVPAELLLEASAAGLECSPEPALVDHVIVTSAAGSTTVLGFDEAWAVAEAGEGFVRLYCSPRSA